MNTTMYPITGKASLPTRPHLTHTLLCALRWLLGSILVVILAMPVLLTFVVTAIPRSLALGLVILDLGLVIVLFRLKRTWRVILGFWFSVIGVTLLTIWLSQVFAATPPLLDANNRPLPNSIAVLEKVNLGGSEQWITIRGKDVTKPVLLYLGIGGPGAGGFPASALAIKPLEDHFVVVNWDQPGTGKSYNAVPISTLTVERFVADAHELTQLLRARFHQDKIYVLGLSWGTILGIKLVQQYPDLFYAYIGTGQMVNTTENDRMGYELALKLVTEQGDIATANTLRRYGPPPYTGDGMALKYAVYNNVLFRYMDSPTLQLVLLLVPQFAREYGFVDKVNFARGLIDSYAVVYPQLRDLDFTTQAAKLAVPVYFLVGRHDVNAMTPLVERYYNVLQAPHKELIWLESAHGATAAEIKDALVNHVLPQTLPKTKAPSALGHGLTNVHETEAFLDKFMATQLRDEHIAGAAVAVVKAGQLFFAKGYGYADLDAERPVDTAQTLFRTDSTGKLFVWTAVMQLVEQGKLNLDADVNTYLDFKIPATFPQPITLKHLLSHNAGFSDQGYMFAHQATDLEPVGVWLARHLPARVRPPGELSGYSNYGVALAGYIVERVSGLPFEQVVEEQIFKPLAMQHSTFRQPIPPALASNVTTNYQYANGVFKAVPFQYLRIPAAGEGHMTVIDMAQFMLAHLQNDDSPLFKAATARQMHSQLFTHDPRVNGIAYGFMETTQNNQHILRHEGNNPGMSSTALFLLPEQQVGVYVVYNSNGGFGPGEALRRAFLDHYFPAPPTPSHPIHLTTAQSQALAGSYRSTRMFYTSFAKVLTLLGGNYADVKVSANPNGAFTTQGIGETPLSWAPVAPQVLQLADGAVNSYGNLVFGMDQDGRVIRLFVGNNPYRAYEKVAWYATVDFQVLWLALCEFIFLFALVGPILAWLVRRLQHKTSPVTSNHWARWLLAGACVCALLFPLGLLLTVGEAILYGVTSALLIVLALPLVAIALAIGALFLALPTWRTMTTFGRIRYSIVLVAFVAFASWLNNWNLLGWRL